MMAGCPHWPPGRRRLPLWPRPAAADLPDRSLRDFDEILPAAGAIHSAVRLSPQQLAEITGGEWVNVCQAANADTA